MKIMIRLSLIRGVVTSSVRGVVETGVDAGRLDMGKADFEISDLESIEQRCGLGKSGQVTFEAGNPVPAEDVGGVGVGIAAPC